MSKVTEVNKFYGDLYRKIGKFSYAPYDWSFSGNKKENSLVDLLCDLMFELPVKIILSPVLLPATAVTFALAAVAAVLAAVTYVFAVTGAAVCDLFQGSDQSVSATPTI